VPQVLTLGYQKEVDLLPTPWHFHKIHR
jgi:hypothetical protein